MFIFARHGGPISILSDSVETFARLEFEKPSIFISPPRRNYLKKSLQRSCIRRAALSWRFQMRVEETISNSLRVGNCFLNLTSICSCSCLKLSVSSTWPSTCFTRACNMSRQWILFPFEMGKLNDTSATVFGLEIPSGGSNEAIKSES